MKSPFISIIIPVPELSEFLLKENLPACAKQTYKQFEVVVLPNKESREDKPLLKKYRFLRIIPTKKISRPALKRDIGAKHAKGDILAFIDDDAFPTRNWLTIAVKKFEEKKVAAVCGPGILPPASPFWERVFDEILKTYIGSGGFAYRFVKKPARFVDDYPSMNFLIKKSMFKKLGGFNNNYWPGEDSKLCEDLVYNLKEKIYYHPSVTIFHHRRDQLWSYLRQHGNYGFHRGAFFAHGDKNSRRFTYLIPTLFVIYLIFILNYSVIPNLIRDPLEMLKQVQHDNFIVLTLYTPLLIYLALLIYIIVTATRNTKSLKIGITSAIVLFLMHISYGVQFIRGLIIGTLHKENIYV